MNKKKALTGIIVGGMALAMSLTAFIPGTASAQVPSAAGKIVFTCQNASGLYDVCISNDDGTGRVNLTNSPGTYDQEPALSEDGKNIAFVTNRDGNWEIYTMDHTGGNSKNITNSTGDDFGPAWSHDGKFIAFESHRDGNSELYRMRFNGRAQTRLTMDPLVDGQPSFGPGDNEIVFVKTFKNGNQEIFAITKWGYNLRNLTNSPANEGAPTVSPGGGHIAYSSNEFSTGDVMVAQYDGTALSNAVDLTSNSSQDGRPSYSVDGTMIAFDSNRDDNNGDIFTMNVDGSNQLNITNTGAFEFSPNWGY